jgi:hypothetical protein
MSSTDLVEGLSVGMILVGAYLVSPWLLLVVVGVAGLVAADRMEKRR